MTSRIAVSSFSFYRLLGPLRLERRNAAGEVEPMVVPMPQEMTLVELFEGVRTRLGIDSVEVCQVQIGDRSAEAIGALRAQLDRLDMTVRTVPIDIGELSCADPVRVRDDVERITGWFDVAKQLGARFVRVKPGSPDDDAQDGLLTALDVLADRADERGLRLLVENHGDRSSDPDFLLGLRDEVGADRLGILLDLGNFEPLIEIALARFLGHEIDDVEVDTSTLYDRIARLAPAATLVHAKALDPARDGTALIDMDRSLQLVARSGFDGPVSIEWEGSHGDPWAHIGEMATSIHRAFPASTSL